MSNTIEEDQKEVYQALYEELELRYGAGLAQEIVDQIKNIEDDNYKPDYMPVKALSEVLEVFRLDTKKSVKKLKNLKSNDLPNNITDLEQQRLQREFDHLWKCYRTAQQGFYRLYNRALKICEVPETYRYDRYTKPTKMKLSLMPAQMVSFNRAA